MNNILTILKKELRRIFTDKRMLISLIIPGIILFIIYTLFGNTLSNAFTPDTNHEYQVYVYHDVESYDIIASSFPYKTYLNKEEKTSIEDAKTLLKNKQIDLIIDYGENFENKVESGEVPNIDLYYNSISTTSSTIYSYYYSVLASSGAQVSYIYMVNSDTSITYDMATSQDTSTMIITMMIPLLLVTMLFSGCISVSTESISGEKERGTIATLLVTPVKRSDIVIGKLLALSIASLVSSVSSFLGIIFSLPKMMSSSIGSDISLASYGVGTYFALFALILVLVLFFTVIIMIISTFSKTVKEASQYSSPLLILIMLSGVATMFSDAGSLPFMYYLIPVFNAVTCFKDIFGLAFNPLYFGLTIGSTIIYISLGVFILTKMFNNEKVMFNCS